MNTKSLHSIMRRLSLMLLLFAVSVGTLLAQGRRMSPEEMKQAFDANFAELTTALALDEETAPKVKEILWTQQEKRTEMMTSMRASGGNALARGGMREKMAELNNETNASLATVLTEEQMTKYAEFQAERQQGRGQGRGQGQGRQVPQ